MGLPKIFEFAKLTIKPSKSGEGEPFELMFNPGSLSIKYENRFARDQTVSKPGNTDQDKPDPGRKPRFLGRDIATLEIKILIDGTGVTDELGLFTGLGFKVEPVSEKVQKFLALTMIPGEQTHSPNNLTLNWGKVIRDFKCSLKSVDINYSLFDRDGSPLRAELNCIFISNNDSDDKDEIISLSSPDLTHVRTVRQGDSLPALCKDIYGDSSYYLKVAQVNELDNFRALEAGIQLFFPPLEKST